MWSVAFYCVCLLIAGVSTFGDDEEISKYPYYASLQHLEYYLCGAAVITPNHIITTARCGEIGAMHELSVRVGSSTFNGGGQIFQIKNRFVHPDFNFLTDEYDVAVMELARPVRVGRHVNTVELSAAEEDEEEESDCNITGWKQGNIEESLQSVDVSKYNAQECRVKYGTAKATGLFSCYGAVDEQHNSCDKYRGGPFICNGKLVGVVSFSEGCVAHNFPGIYTKLSNPKIIAFINNQIY